MLQEKDVLRTYPFGVSRFIINPKTHLINIVTKPTGGTNYAYYF